MKIRNHEELEVFQQAYRVSLEIHTLTKSFPKEEQYCLTNQVRRSSRSICANLAEAFRKRYFQKSFVSKINECEGEAAETQVWIKYAADFEYIESQKSLEIRALYDVILKQLVIMRNQADKWSIDH
jgi:four helix bundle protein